MIFISDFPLWYLIVIKHIQHRHSCNFDLFVIVFILNTSHVYNNAQHITNKCRSYRLYFTTHKAYYAVSLDVWPQPSQHKRLSISLSVWTVSIGESALSLLVLFSLRGKRKGDFIYLKSLWSLFTFFFFVRIESLIPP